MANDNNVLDQMLSGDSTKALDDLISTGPVKPGPTASPEAPGDMKAVDSLISSGGTNEKPSKDMKSMLGDFYQGLVSWASTPTRMPETKDLLNPLRFQENLNTWEGNMAKGVVETALTAPVGLVKLEHGGLKEWIQNPKGSLEALKEGPSIIHDTVLVPMIDDIKDAITHPIRYSFEKPIQQLLNLSIITGLGAGAKGMTEAAKVARANELLEGASKLTGMGLSAEAKMATESADALMGKIGSEGLKQVAPQYDQLMQDLSYQKWLETYSPLTSRGIKPAVTREITPMTEAKQFGKVEKIDKLVGMDINPNREGVPNVYLEKAEDGTHTIMSPAGKPVGNLSYVMDDKGNANIIDVTADSGEKFGVGAVEALKQNPEVKTISGIVTPETKSWWEHNFNVTHDEDGKFTIPVREGFKTTFKNTEEAEAYGAQIKGNQHGIKALEDKNEELTKLIDEHKAEIESFKTTPQPVKVLPEALLPEIQDQMSLEGLALNPEQSKNIQDYISKKVVKFWESGKPKKFRTTADEIAWRIADDNKELNKTIQQVPTEKFQAGLDLATQKQKINEALAIAKTTSEDPSKLASVTEHIRDSIYNKAITGEIPAEGQLDATNYYRYAKERMGGPVQKVVIPEQYMGDYRSIQPATYSLPKTGKGVDSIDTRNTIFNDWSSQIRKMKHPEHGQAFVSDAYKPEGEFPKFPERVYPWIEQKTKGPYPVNDVSALETKVLSPGQVMRNAWGMHNPLVDAFEAQQVAQLNAKNSFSWFNRLAKGVEPAVDEVKTAMAPYFNNHIRLNQKLLLVSDPGVREALGKELLKNYDAAYKVQLQLAAKHPDVRMALYAQDALPAEIVKNMSAKEIRISEMVKAYYTKTGQDMERVGIPTIQGKAYVRHIVGEEMRAAGGDYSKMPDYVKQYIPKDVAFAHRTSEFDWYPSLVAGMDNYIPIVERKVAMQAYLNHWRDTVDISARSGNKAAQTAQQMIMRNMSKTVTPESIASNFVTKTNYFLQLFGNARVAVKHLVGGMPGVVSEVGPFTSLEALGYMVKHPFQSADMMKTFAKMGDIVKALDASNDFEVHANRFWKGLQGQPVAAMEYLENGVNILGNLIKGGKEEGLNPQILRDYIWNKVTSVNFRGGWDIPSVFSSPGGRVLFQYSLEPHKVWEYRGELVKRALAGERDIFGSSYGSKLVQYVTVLGAMEKLARSQGKTLIDTIAATPYVDVISPKKDFPYVKHEATRVKFGPGVQMVAKLAGAAGRGDVTSMLDYFVNYGLESGVGILGQLSKIGSNKIPTYYKDAVSYLLGLPEVDQLEQRNAKSVKFLKYRSQVEELAQEKSLLRKNPALKHIVVFKRDFRKALRDFMSNPAKHLEGVSKYNQVPDDQIDQLDQIIQ